MYNIGDFSFRYNQTDEKKLFSQTNFTLPKKGLVLVAGPSGSGKSTFLNLLKGIIPEFISGNLTGEILFANKKLDGENFQKNLKRIVYLFQNPHSQIIHQSVTDEFYFSLENYQAEYEDAIKIKNDLSKKFDLDHLWEKETRNLSHGECQKLILASLLTLCPEVLLLDEPTAFLDPYERKNFYDLLSVLKKDHLIIMIDHHVNEVLDKADLLITVDPNGEIRLEKELIIPDYSVRNNLKLPPALISPPISIFLQNLKFHYPRGATLIDIKEEKLNSGEIIIIQGRNGSGKSTLLKLIAGFIEAPKERIKFHLNGLKILENEIFSQLGFIFQNPESCFLFDTLKEELGEFDFGFSPIELERSPHLFSEGEKRRISIFMALAQNKNVLLYDEPTFGQDKNNIKMLTEIILNLKAQNKLQIIISHDEEFIKNVGDRTLIINEGVVNG